MNSHQELEEFYSYLGILCKVAAQISQADASAIYLKEDEQFVMRASFGYDRDMTGKASYRLGEGITGWIGEGEGHRFKADSPKDIESNEHHAGKYNTALWATAPFQCWSLLGEPLLLGKKVVGILKVENKKRRKKPSCFSQEDVRVVEVWGANPGFGP